MIKILLKEYERRTNRGKNGRNPARPTRVVQGKLKLLKTTLFGTVHVMYISEICGLGTRAYGTVFGGSFFGPVVFPLALKPAKKDSFQVHHPFLLLDQAARLGRIRQASSRSHAIFQLRISKRERVFEAKGASKVECTIARQGFGHMSHSQSKPGMKMVVFPEPCFKN